jgi:ABC-type transporter lipoprotein component MlaA
MMTAVTKTAAAELKAAVVEMSRKTLNTSIGSGGGDV